MKRKMDLAEFEEYCRGICLREAAFCSADQDDGSVNCDLHYAQSYKIILTNPLRRTITLRGDTGVVTFRNVMRVLIEHNRKEEYDILQILCENKACTRRYCVYIF